MSLINDALKKAQKQRTEGNTPASDLTTPSVSTEPLHRVARREKPAGFRSQLMLIGGGAAVAVILLAISAVFFLRSKDQPAESPKPAQVATAPTPAPAAATPTPVAPPVATATTAATVAPLTLPVTSPTPAATTLAPAQPLSLPPVASTQTPAAAPATGQFAIQTPPPAASTPITAPSVPAAVERPKASTRMIGVIEHYKVGGIRVSGADSKVLMNDKVYRVNDIVDHELGIRLTGIEAKALTFEDERGAVHTRYF